MSYRMFLSYEYNFLIRPNRLTPRPIRIESSRKQKDNLYLVKFEYVNSRLTAIALKNFIMYVKVDDRPVLGEDEYLVRDLVGMECYAENEVEKEEVKEMSVIESNNKKKKLPKVVNVGDIKGEGCWLGTVVGVVPPDELCDPGTVLYTIAMYSCVLKNIV